MINFKLDIKERMKTALPCGRWSHLLHKRRKTRGSKMTRIPSIFSDKNVWKWQTLQWSQTRLYPVPSVRLPKLGPFLESNRIEFGLWRAGERGVSSDKLTPTGEHRKKEKRRRKGKWLIERKKERKGNDIKKNFTTNLPTKREIFWVCMYV